jgi:hypothetical protein
MSKKIIDYNKIKLNPNEMLICPKGPKMKRFFEDLCAIARVKKFSLPPDFGNYCISGKFSGCLTHGANEKIHLREFYFLIDWITHYKMNDYMQNFLESLDREDLLTNPLLSNDTRIPYFKTNIKDNSNNFAIHISSDEIRKINPQINSFPPKEIDFKKNNWLKDIWICEKYDLNLIHCPSLKVFKIDSVETLIEN